MVQESKKEPSYAMVWKEWKVGQEGKQAAGMLAVQWHDITSFLKKY